MGYSTGLTSITGSVTAAMTGVPATAIKFASVNTNANASGTLATITAGKTGYIVGASISLSNKTSATNMTATMSANGVAFLATCASLGTTVASGNNSAHFTAPTGCGIQIAATQTITYATSASDAVTYSVYYIEV